jgi:hypothetical protein
LEAARAGIRPGDVIESIDGEPAPSLLERKLREEIGSSTPQAARSRAVALLLDGTPNTGVQVVWRDIDDKRNSASFRRQWHQRNFVLQINQRGNRAVVVIDAFTQAITRDLARALKEKLHHTRGIVLDLRNNGGGDAEAMADIASYFLPAASMIGQFTNRSGNVALSLETGASPSLSADRIDPTFRLSFSQATGRRARPRSSSLLYKKLIAPPSSAVKPVAAFWQFAVDTPCPMAASLTSANSIITPPKVFAWKAVVLCQTKASVSNAEIFTPVMTAFWNWHSQN